MGAVIRRLAVLAALLALAAPSTAHATDTSYGAPFAAGPKGGDPFNIVHADAASGEMFVVRANPVPTNGGLGCGGSGGFANFAVSHSALTPLQSVTVEYEDAVIDPYTWINVGVRQGADYLDSVVVQGIVAGSGDVIVDVSDLAATGEVTVWFGLQVASACPNVDGGAIRFISVTFTEF